MGPTESELSSQVLQRWSHLLGRRPLLHRHDLTLLLPPSRQDSISRSRIFRR